MLFTFKLEQYCNVTSYHLLFIHVRMGTWAHNIVMNIVVEVSLWVLTCHSLGNMLRSRVSLSCGDCGFFLETPSLLLTVTALFCSPSSNEEGFYFLYIFTNACHFWGGFNFLNINEKHSKAIWLSCLFLNG